MKPHHLLATPLVLFSMATVFAEDTAKKPPAAEVQPKSGGERKTSELERAILELPPQFVADIPAAKRAAFLASMRRDPSDTRLDVKHGFLHYSSDGGDHGDSFGTSMLYMKQFKRADGGFVVLTHMPKPFADSSVPKANQTFVFERLDGKWTDITTKVFPEGLDRTNHFRPLKDSTVVEVAPYVGVKRADGRGNAYDFGPPAFELSWNGKVFEKRKTTKKALSKD